MTGETVAFIFARGGSKGLPGKNLKPLLGKPLLARAIEAARACRGVSRVVVSTDDEALARMAREQGAEVPFLRPAELATDTAPEWAAWQHAIREFNALNPSRPVARFLSVPAIAPLRSVEDLEACLRRLEEPGVDLVMTVRAAERHPLFSMVVRDAAGFCQLASTPPQPVSRRQDAPEMFDITPVAYASRPEHILRAKGIFDGRVACVVVPKERAVDIDDEIDFLIAEALMKRAGGLSGERPVHVGGRRIGEGAPCWIIAEAGVNHNGDPALALRLVEAAHAAGADAVKFQTFRADELASADAPKAAYQAARGEAGESQRDMLRSLELAPDAIEKVRKRALELGLAFLSTPFDIESARLLAGLGVPAIKLPSGELTNEPFLRAVARLGKPVLLSTGMANLPEVEGAVAALRGEGCEDIVLLQCVSAYPAPPAEANLRAMRTLRDRFGVPVGFSDHTLGIEIALAAAALGACVIEKHLTLDKSMRGPDHAASLDPEEFARMVRAVRAVESALGDGQKIPAPSEIAVAAVARRSLVATRALEAGTTLAAEMIAAQRPGTGLPPTMLSRVIGRKLARPVRPGVPLTREDLE